MHTRLVASVLAFLLLSLQPAANAENDARTQPESPRLRALAAALDAHDEHALAAFWTKIAAEHTPLIESVPGRPQDALYTFLWRAEPDQVALNVRFNGMFPMHQATGFDPFTRLGESNVWYTSYVLDRTARLRYELVAPRGWQASPNRNALFTMDGTEYETFTDPLNGRTITWDRTLTSYVAGPDAKTSPYFDKRSDVPAGSVETLDIDSKILGNRRTVRIYVPPGYRSTTQAPPLLLAFDGNQYTMWIPTPVILDNMIAAGVIPAVLGVFVESPDRDVELPPNDSFQRFVGEELLPQVRAHYRFNQDARRNVVLGSSYGGIGAAYTAFKHPDVFGNVISQSGSYWWSQESAGAPAGAPAPNVRGLSPDGGWFIKQIAEAPRKNIRFCLDVGSWEGSNLLASNRLLRSVLIGKGYEVHYQERPGNHSAYYWMERLPDELRLALHH